MNQAPEVITEKTVKRIRLRSLFERLRGYVAIDLWLLDLKQERGAKRAFLRVAQVLLLAVHEFRENRGSSQSAALSYVTVLSLVPLLALAFAMVKGMGAYDYLVTSTIQPALGAAFGEVDQVEEAAGTAAAGLRLAIDRVLEFVDQTDVWSMGVVGLLVLLYTVTKLLSSIEESFNTIWGVRKARRIQRKITDYLTLVVITPLFLVVATAATAAAQTSGAVVFMRDVVGLGVAVDVMFRLIPLLAVSLALTVLYWFMPNQRVRLKSALFGGVVGGVAWQVNLMIQLQFQVGMARYNAIYSGFAAIPLFLAWVYLSWLIVLIGAELAYAHQHHLQSRPLHKSIGSHSFFEGRLALSVLTTVGAAFQKGEPAYTETRLADGLKVRPSRLRTVLRCLIDSGLIAPGSRNGDETYFPARPLEQMRISSVLESVGAVLPAKAIEEQGALEERADRALGSLYEVLEGLSENTTVLNLIEGDRAEGLTTETGSG